MKLRAVDHSNGLYPKMKLHLQGRILEAGEAVYGSVRDLDQSATIGSMQGRCSAYCQLVF